MEKALRQAIRAARFDRTVYSQLLFDDYATGNAILLLAGIAVITTVGQVGLDPRLTFGASLVATLLNVVLATLWGWVIAAGILWLVGTKLFRGEARYQTVLRMVGFAYLPFVLLALAPLDFLKLEIVGSWLVLISLAWFGGGLYLIAEDTFGLSKRDAGVAAGLAVVGWLAVRLLIGR